VSVSGRAEVIVIPLRRLRSAWLVHGIAVQCRQVTQQPQGSHRMALLVVIAPVVAVLAIAMLLYFTAP
jgi:hypothetical protein